MKDFEGLEKERSFKTSEWEIQKERNVISCRLFLCLTNKLHTHDSFPKYSRSLYTLRLTLKFTGKPISVIFSFGSFPRTLDLAFNAYGPSSFLLVWSSLKRFGGKEKALKHHLVTNCTLVMHNRDEYLQDSCISAEWLHKKILFARWRKKICFSFQREDISFPRRSHLHKLLVLRQLLRTVQGLGD